MTKKIRSPQFYTGGKGISTVEVILSLFIISAALVVYSSSLNLVRLTKSTKYQDIAYHAAIKKIEDLRNTPFSSLPASGSFSDPNFLLLPSGSGQITVTNQASDLTQVQVLVTWSEQGNLKTVNLTTLIYASGLNTL